MAAGEGCGGSEGLRGGVGGGGGQAVAGGVIAPFPSLKSLSL